MFFKKLKLAKIPRIALSENSSGESSSQYANMLDNRELNKVFYFLALTQIRKEANPIMYDYFQKKIREGRKKKQAMAYVERRLVNILYRIMKDKAPYVQPEPKVEKEGAWIMALERRFLEFGFTSLMDNRM
ncbi:hypothetical protein [Virgibacillus sp. SK37]|uniref:hypothetical protein n=1 Tax=Virgibacillus sp. SK37 TaxID=403957 RepID=UPI0004D16CA9|nr:hypothetical protein [Virgibacillus sp. SK37]AIF45564.1 hypothetical protein X953_16415 [Virgibacillus sp. SK37]